MALQATEAKDNNTDQSKTSTSDSGYWTGKRAFKKKIDGKTTYMERVPLNERVSLINTVFLHLKDKD